MNVIEDKKELTMILHSFVCDQDEAIERFLYERAIEFEELSKTRTYLICDQEQLEKNGMEALIIYGYISLALKILSVASDVSNRVRKELDGFSAKLHGEVISDFPCYLIGQLARNSNVPDDSISGKQLMKFAFDIIAASAEAVGGRFVLIECRPCDKLIQFYQDNSFKEIAKIPDYQQPMIQMIRKIC